MTLLAKVLQDVIRGVRSTVTCRIDRLVACRAHSVDDRRKAEEPMLMWGPESQSRTSYQCASVVQRGLPNSSCTATSYRLPGRCRCVVYLPAPASHTFLQAPAQMMKHLHATGWGCVYVGGGRGDGDRILCINMPGGVVGMCQPSVFAG